MGDRNERPPARRGVYIGINIYFEEDDEDSGRIYIVGETIGKKVRLQWRGPRPNLRVIKGAKR